MHETQRLLDAASALSMHLRERGIPHAFHGSILTAALSKSPFGDASVFPSSCNMFSNLCLWCYRRFYAWSKGARTTRIHFVGSRRPFLGMGTLLLLLLPGQIGWYRLLVNTRFLWLIIVCRLHVTYRQPIPSIDVSGFEFVHHLQNNFVILI